MPKAGTALALFFAWSLAHLSLVTALAMMALLLTPTVALSSIDQGASPVKKDAGRPPAATSADDPYFGGPYIDVDEWRDVPRRYRFVHGGFKDTGATFSFYMPPPELFKGRTIMMLEGGYGGLDRLLEPKKGEQASWEFNLAFDELGAVLLETNEGWGPGTVKNLDDDVALWRTSAQASRFARKFIAREYGKPVRYGYVYGASGGGLRSRQAIENAPDVFQGAVPQVFGLNSALWSIQGLVYTLIDEEKMNRIVDAAEPGGSGDVFAGLDSEQRDALAMLYRLGWPRGAEGNLRQTTAGWQFGFFHLLDNDPAYFGDFWKRQGYLGHDAPERLKPVLLDVRTTIKRMTTAPRTTGNASNPSGIFAGMAPDQKVGMVLGVRDPSRLLMAKVTFLSGKARGKEIYVTSLGGEVVRPLRNSGLLADVQVGDEVRVDNRDRIASSYYHRYAPPTIPTGMRSAGMETIPERRALAVDGRHLYPQRPQLSEAWGDMGRFQGKMIDMAATLDMLVWPSSVSIYPRIVRHHLGDRTDKNYRFWWMENASHAGLASPTRIDYSGMTAQALRDVVRWVEDGVPPPPSSTFSFSPDNALMLPASAEKRGGIQPVVILRANGQSRVEIQVGESVRFAGVAKVPPGAGKLVRAEWDFEGGGKDLVIDKDVAGASRASHAADLKASHQYDQPGVFFASLRVGAHRQGPAGRGPLVTNLARVRVVVRP